MRAGVLHWADVVRRFRRDRLAMAGLIVLVVFGLMAVLAPLIRRHVRATATTLNAPPLRAETRCAQRGCSREPMSARPHEPTGADATGCFTRTSQRAEPAKRLTLNGGTWNRTLLLGANVEVKRRRQASA